MKFHRSQIYGLFLYQVICQLKGNLNLNKSNRKSDDVIVFLMMSSYCTSGLGITSNLHNRICYKTTGLNYLRFRINLSPFRHTHPPTHTHTTGQTTTYDTTHTHTHTHNWSDNNLRYRICRSYIRMVDIGRICLAIRTQK